MSVTILVPGFSDDIAILGKLEHFLQQQGLAAYAISPQPSDGSVGIDLLAQQLADTMVQRFPPETMLNFVGFSMGGLICRSYIQQMDGLARTERLVTIATPHQGTWTAYGYHRPACLQMRPGSRFLTQLNRDLSPLAQINFTSIWTPLDLMVLPASSSWLPVGEMAPILSPFHRTMVFDVRILKAVAACLCKPYNGERKQHRQKGQPTRAARLHP